MKKKLMMMVAALVAAFGAWADDTWTDPDTGYTWTYRINGDMAEIFNDYSAAISPKPTGAVTIPSTLGGKPVTSIGSSAFSGCSGLTSVTIPNSVTSIGACAFYDCRKIVSVMIPDSVTSIGDWAFRDCRGLVSVTIPGSVASIGDAAFYECSALTSVTICNGVTNIGESAFEYCSRLVDMTIPDSVTSIGYGAFYETPFYDGQPNGLVVFGRVAYEMRGNCPRSVVIPDGIVSIGTDAFYDCYELSSVAMPDSLTSIGDFAFCGCKNLVDVTIPDSVASIGDCAFECSGLMSVTIGKGVESIGYAAFWKCSQLENVSFPDSLTSIGESAFSFCSGLKSVTIPNNVANIGECVFQCCDGLTNVVIETGVESIGGGAFSSCSRLTSVTIPDSVTSIGYRAFEWSGLTSVTIPNSVTNIGTMAFSGCRGLADADGFVVVQDVLYDYVGSNREVTIPDGVSFIDDESFYDCGGLTSVTIPGSVTSIDNGAFYGCSKLTRIMVDASNPYFSSANGLLLSKDGKKLILGVNGDVVIPDGVKSIDYGAFEYRSGLTSVTIPDSVTNIGDFAFFGCENLKSVTIPASVMNIGNQAFDNCSKLETVRFLGDAPIVGRQCFDSVNPSCTAYVREDSTGWGGDMWNGLSIEYAYVERAKIDFRAGGGSGSMETVYVDVDGTTYYTLPACRFSRSGYSFVGWRVYDPCGLFDALFFPSGVPYELCGGDYTLTAMWSQDGNPALSIEDGVLLLVYPNGHSSVSIPDGVTSIGDGAFYGCGGLTSVTIPGSVTSIGSGAFSGCGGLMSISVGSGNVFYKSVNGLLLTKDGKTLVQGINGDVVIPDSVMNIGYAAFRGRIGLTSVIIPNNVKDIGDGAFVSCIGLQSLTIPGSVTNIESFAFASCSSLTSVAMGNGVVRIGNMAFYKCSKLTSVAIPDSMTSVEWNAFYGCTEITNIRASFVPRAIPKEKLTSVTIPDSASRIRDSAFSGCGGLTSITIPNSVTSIGDRAFSDCGGLTNITIPDSVTDLGGGVFYNCGGLTNVVIGHGVRKLPSMEIPDDFLSSIADYYGMFENCYSLLNVIIPDSVTSIGGDAFAGCSSLASVTIPDSVRSIGSSAFRDCSGLTSVTIPDSVTSIGDWAFSGCGDMTSVFFGGNAPSVANWAFRDCACTVYVPYGSTGWDVPIPGTWKGLKIRYLTYVTVTFDANGGTGGWSRKLDRGSAIVPPTVTREWFIFTGWSPAVAVTVPANDVTYTAQWQRYGDTISTSKISGKTMRELYPDDYMRMTTVVLEEGITELPAGFFDGCDNVEDLTLPESLREFGIDDLPPKIRASLAYDANGFMIYNGWILGYQDRSAAAVTIPEGIVGIGRGVFKEMFDLETVTMPESLRCIATSAFEDCSWIQNLQFMSGLRYVGPEAFRGCSSLLGASFADGVEHIGANAFKDCWQMTSVRLPYTVAYIGDGAFTGCSAIRGVTVPTHLKKMQNLFPAAYSQIGTAEVAEGETTVMDDMFKGCVVLRGGATQTDMSMIPNTVTNIGARAFQGCTSLTAFVVPDSVVKIGASVFQGCSSLWNVTLSRSLTEIPDYAFDGCSMLETMVVPENVNYLGNRFFSGKYRGVNALYYLCANAPDYHSGAYAAIAGNMTTYVLQNSRSWDGRQGSRVLPQSWNGYDITYWMPNRFDVTFDANGGRFDSMGGSTWSEQQITDTTYALPSTEPVRPGWAFEGWWTEQTGGAEVRYTTVVTATRTHTIYAHWRSLGNKMTVMFNSNGGTVVTPGTQDYVPGQTFGQFPVPTRRGYTFQGWWTEAVNGIRMTEATQVPAADMELFAHWKPITYYVHFHANGGTGTMSDQPFTFDVSGELKTHAFTRTGFAFTGWATTPSGQVRYAENKTVVNLEEVDGHIVDLYAVWSGVGYSVRFDSNGGTGIMDNQTIAVGETQNLWPCAFARGGYTFAGWAVSPTDAEAKKVTYRDGQAVRNLATSNGATVPLYAVWVTGSQTVRITFDANGGSVAPNDYWDCVVGTAVEAFPTPTRPGFTFAGWWTERAGGTRMTSIARVTSAQTFYAHWTENGGVVPGDNSVTVTFNGNGGSVTETQRTVASGAAVGELPKPKRTGYIFSGWWTAAEGGIQVDPLYVVNSSVTFYAHWISERVVQAQMCKKAFSDSGTVELDANDNIVVTLTGDVSGTVEIPNNVGAVTIDLNGHDMVGDDGPAIRIVKGDGEGATTQLAIVDTSDGEKGQIAGGGESAGIEVAEDAASGVRLDVEESVGVFNGDGSEQPWWELCPVEATLVVGEYFRMTLAELGYDVPTNGTPYEVKALGLPAGLKLVSNKAEKDKKGKITKKAKSEWWIEGVSTTAVDFFTNPPYLVITANGAKTTESLPVEVLAQNVTELEDLALGQTVNEQFYLPGVTNGWTVTGLPKGLKYTAKRVTEKLKSGKKKIVVTKAQPYSVYGKTTKSGLFTITAKKKVGAFYETKKFRVLVRPAAVNASLFGEDLTNITTMAYVPINWDLTGGVQSVPPVPFVPSSIGGNLAKVTGLPTGLTFAAKDAYAYTNAKKKGKYLKQKGQTIVGTPTKPGTYVVTFTKNVKEKVKGKTKTVAKTAQVLWVVTQNDAELLLGFNNIGGVIESGVVGLKYTDMMAFAATSNATVTASGLPAGIKLANLGGGAYAFTGYTAKAGTYLVTVKATLNGKTVTQRVALKVDALPAWAKGTFNGYVAGEDGATNGLATVTVSAAGKVSGKFYDRGTNWTFTAASYTAAVPEAASYSEFSCSNVVAKFAYKVTKKVKGKKKTVTKYVTRSFTLTVAESGTRDACPYRGVATLEEVGGGSTVRAWQNLWGSTYKALGKTLFSSKSGKKTLAYRTFAIKSTDPAGEAMGLLPTETLSLKVTTAGAVTATMSFGTGKKSKGKAVIYKATCSTVVIPLTAPDATEFKGMAFIYFAPSPANNFPGFAAAVPF